MFKECACCGCGWRSRQALLADPGVQLVGYQPNFDDLALGFFLFDHGPCHSSFAVPAGAFMDLYDGPIFDERKTNSDKCPGLCLHEHELRPCPERCECASVRNVLHLIDEWPKAAVQA